MLGKKLAVIMNRLINFRMRDTLEEPVLRVLVFIRAFLKQATASQEQFPIN